MRPESTTDTGSVGMAIPGPISLEEYERTHYQPETDDTTLYATTP